MMVESIRHDKWLKSQENTKYFIEIFENFISFDNTGNLDTKEEDIHEIYQTTKVFLDAKSINETAEDWLNRNVDINQKISLLFKEEKHVKSDSKSTQIKTIGRYNPSFRAKGPADIKPDNSSSLVGDRDQISGDTGPRKNPNGKGHSGGAWHSAYTESAPTLKISPQQKEPNFQKDNDKNKKLKRGNTSLSASRVGRPDGVGQTYDTRAGGKGAAAGAGLGDQTYSESEDYSNAQPSSSALPGSSSMSPNPLSSAYDIPKKEFKKFRNKQIKKEAIDHHTSDMGVGGTLSGAGNKEGMDTYFDQRRIGLTIQKKGNKKFNQSKDDGKD
jgi:hypothetical protein